MLYWYLLFEGRPNQAVQLNRELKVYCGFRKETACQMGSEAEILGCGGESPQVRSGRQIRYFVS